MQQKWLVSFLTAGTRETRGYPESVPPSREEENFLRLSEHQHFKGASLELNLVLKVKVTLSVKVGHWLDTGSVTERCLR